MNRGVTFGILFFMLSSSSLAIPNVHRVVSGETLYAIAWQYGLDYRKLATLNHINPPYTILSGQALRLQNKKQSVLTAKKIDKQMVCAFSKKVIWMKPTQGKIIRGFSWDNKGVNFTGFLGSPIVASADGKVVYSGRGLRGYGNLIILKHNHVYLSAYAHARTSLVKEGQWVRKGQKIAEMGDTGTDRVMLHFEIRRAGKPVDPIVLMHS